MSYISLHNHSHFSIFDGYSKIPDIVSKAKSLGQTAISLTEHGTLSSVLPFYKECNKQGVKAIIGNEFYTCSDVTIRDRKQMYHLIVLAKNNIGYHNLLKLDTLAYQNFYYKPRVDFSMLEEHKEGLIFLSACMGSIINTDSGEYWAKEFQKMFGSDFYLEIQSNTMPDQKVYNEKVIGISKLLNIPLVVTSDSHYPSQADAKYHKLWVNLNKGENDYYPTDDFFIMGEEDIYARLQYLDRWIVDAAIMNTALIAQECNVEIKVEGNHFPVFPVDDKLKTIKDICRDGWKQKIVPYIPKDKLKEYQERLLHELDVLEKCDYLNYLLITWDILDWCKRNDILTGIGRGSCGGSLVCYLMDITKLDPIEHDLLFSRFVNIERVTSADIDNDIEDTRRGDVINYIREKYGEVYNIRTFNFLGVKGSIQRACQALKIAPRISIELSKNTESLDDIQGYEEMVDIARHFKDLLHAFGCHASAVMIFPDSPSNYTPIEKQKDTFLAAYDYHDLEAMSLVKMDILGLRNLTIIHDTLRMIDEPLDIYRLPLDDAEVYEQYAEGHTMGIFQAESSLMRQYAKQMKVDKFEDIAALISLVRPGPLDSGMAQQYIDGKNGGEIRVLHPVLEDILGVSFQVLVYQEQLLSIAQKMGGMSLGESDVLRKVVARKELDKDEHGLTPVDYAVKNFIEKSVANGISQEVAVEIGRQITACGRYIFNKSHGFLYAYTSYITAYMKKKFTIQYMCCLLNSVIGDLEKTPEYIKECQRLDITIVPPNLQLSKEKFTISDNSILYGLTAIKGIGKNLSTLKTATFADVIQCNSKGVTEALIKSGALSYLGHSRALLLVNLNPLQDILKRQSQCNIQIVENQQKLSASTTEKDHKKYSRQLQSWREKLSQCEHQESQQVTGEYDEIAGECEVLGFSFQSIPKIKSGLLVKIFEKKDKNGNLMSFLNLETKYGDFRATCFTTGWLKIKSNVKQGETYDFVVSDTGILTEIRISGSVIKTNERKRYN